LGKEAGKMGGKLEILLEMLNEGVINEQFDKEIVSANRVEVFKLALIRRVLDEDIRKQDYTRIQKLFEGGHISNEKLADMIDKPRAMIVGFKDIIFFDIKVLLSNEIAADPALGELFVSVYSKKYNAGYRIAKKGIKNGKESIQSQVAALNYVESAFCLYVILNNEDASDETCLDNELFKMWKTCIAIESSFLSDDCSYNMGRYKQLTFSETEDSILLSKQFERFLSKRKSEIAEYLGIQEEGIPDAITAEMDLTVEREEKNYQFESIKWMSKCVVMENNGGCSWLSDMSRRGKYFYQPDVDRIIKSYYTVRVVLMYKQFINETGRFSKLDLSRGWVSNAEMDVQNICCMYSMDRFYRMFSEILKEYYRTFSWEKITSENMRRRYDQMVSELNLIIEEQKNQIDSLTRRISLLESKPSGDDGGRDKTVIEYERQNVKLIKEIEQKDSEIVRLKDYVRSQEEFLALQSGTEPDETATVNEDNLRTRKYLFVGKIDEALPDLKKKFPGSIFMQSENTDISDISVDAVVFLTKWMSHAMFYKVKKSRIYQKVPSAMCNTKNIDRIFFDMESQLCLD